MTFQIIIVLGLIFLLNGCFHIGSGTVIKISGVTQLEYENIKKDIRKSVTQLNPPMDCDSDESFKTNRDTGELICEYGNLYTEVSENNASVVYAGGTEFWIPIGKEIISDQHQEIQKLFVSLAMKYKKLYPYSTVEVIFYHQDLPKEGRKLF